MTKRTLAFLICMVFALSALAVSAAASTVTLGDVNGDGQCSAIDYFVLKRYILGTYSLPESSLPAADLNGDNEVSTPDYMLLKRVILGTYELPQPEEEFPEDTLTALIKLSISLQNGQGEEVASLENNLPLDGELLGKLLEDYFASNPTISEGDIASLLESEEALQTFANMISQAILDGLLSKQPQTP